MIGVAQATNSHLDLQADNADGTQLNDAVQRRHHNQQGNATQQTVLAYKFLPFADVERNLPALSIEFQHFEGCNELVLDLLRVVSVQIDKIRSIAIVLHADVYTTKYKHVNIAGMANLLVYRFDSVGNLLETDILQPMPFPAVPLLGVSSALPINAIWASIAAIVEQLHHILGKVLAQQGRYA